jgi:uncharacterized protein DUF3891
MLYREDSQGPIVIGQPAHAWISGQMARAWGNQRFGTVIPFEEVCLGAEQHDIAHADWERAPKLNPQTGRPYSFLELPKTMHIPIVSSASSLVLNQARYAALLVSLHFTGLYQGYDTTQGSTEDSQAVQAFLAREYAFQEQLLTSFRSDPYYAPYATPDIVARNQELIRTWDAMSLTLCFGLKTPKSFSNIPTAGSTTTLTLIPANSDSTQVAIDPWPFGQNAVTVRCDGRRLPETFTDEEAMQAALAHAPWVTIIIHPRPV